jgi:hypothetical protein
MKNIPLLLAACVAFLPAVITAQGTATVPTSAPATRTRASRPATWRRISPSSVPTARR